MEVIRVARYRSPRYPAKAALGREELPTPKRWQVNAKVAAAMTGALVVAPLIGSARAAQRRSPRQGRHQR